MYKIIKRNGNKVPYSPTKIKNAISLANSDIDNIATQAEINVIYETAKNKVEKLLQEREISVDEINDIVEETMMRYDCYELAKQFIEYRYRHKLIRESNTTDESIFELINGTSEYWNRENSNKNAKLLTTQRDYIAGITSTDIARRFIFPKKSVEAHDQGIIHIHDMDYAAEKQRINCCLVNLEDMLQNGTVLNGITIEKPHRFITACTIATQIIVAVSASNYGGTTITLTHLAPFVRCSFYRHFKFYVKEILGEELNSEINEDTRMDSDLYKQNQTAYNYAVKQVKKEVEDGVQTFNYQVNSMSSTNGQAPFLSVCMYLGETDEYKDELAMIIEEFLIQRALGMKNPLGVYITVAFPKLLYVLEKDNIEENSKYWYLTQLAAKCSAKRLVPDYISEKVMKEYKVNQINGEGDVYPCMGCRSFLTPDRIKGNPAKATNYNPNKGKYYGRFNMGVASVNIPAVAVLSKGNLDEFWKLLDNYCELCHDVLRVRVKRLEECTSDIAPILYQYGAFARLDKGENLKPLIYGGYATISLGYAGLYETVKFFTGKSNTEKEGIELQKQIMQFLNDKCNEWKKAENIDYSLYGTPIENTVGKFAKAVHKLDKDFFVKIDGKDRDFITNSYHVFVEEEIDAFDKLALEGEYQKLSPGGCISYVESADLTSNIEVVLELLKFMYDHTMYAEINTKSDYCQVCGFDKEIEIVDNNHKLMYRCPNCGNTDDKKMNVARRVCGYISTNIPNQSRLEEIANRYVHIDNHIQAVVN